VIYEIEFSFAEPSPFKSGAKVAAVQTLRAAQRSATCAKRLDCGVFTAAFSRNTV
jgi:hypothetical protein